MDADYKNKLRTSKYNIEEFLNEDISNSENEDNIKYNKKAKKIRPKNKTI